MVYRRLYDRKMTGPFRFNPHDLIQYVALCIHTFRGKRLIDRLITEEDIEEYMKLSAITRSTLRHKARAIIYNIKQWESEHK